MSEYDDLTSQIIDSIDYIVKERLRTAPFDKTRTGIITAVLGNNMYTVKIDNTEYDVLSLSDSTLPVNSIVKVLVPENEYNNMFILNSSVSGETVQGVSSVNGKTGDVVIVISDIANLASQLASKLTNTDDLKTNVLTFTQANTRSAIQSGETIATIIGKIAKWYADLKTVAFTGDYDDLGNKPTIPENTSDLINDSNYVSDSNYNHTDNNYTTTEKNKLAGLSNYDDTEIKADIQAATNIANEADTIAKQANKALGVDSYQALVTLLNSAAKTDYNVGQSFLVRTLNVPDLWVYSVDNTSSTYTYVDDATIINALNTTGYVKMGYYNVSQLETIKQDLTNYVENTDYATNNTGGVIKWADIYFTNVNSTGQLQAKTKTYEQYTDASDSAFVGKGTLENVLTERIKGDFVHYIAGSGSTAAKTTSPYYAARWRGTDDKITVLYTGLTISYKTEVAGHGTYGVLLDINELGEHPVVYGASANVGTRYGVGSIVTLTYDADATASVYKDSTSAVSITGTWKLSDYDSTNVYRLRHDGGNYVADTNLYRYQILLSKNETTLVPINAVNNSTSTSKTLTTSEFNPFYEILYYDSTTTVNAGSNISAAALYSHRTLDLRYSFNTGSTLTAHKDVFIVAVPQSNGMAKLHTSPISQTLPTTDDGLIYIFLGHANSTSNIELEQNHPIYWYKDGKLQLYTGMSQYNLPEATSSVLGGVKIGSNISVNEGTISISDDDVTGALGYTPLDSDLKGANNGIAELDSTGKVPTSQLPTILTLGETSSTAYRGDRGKAAYDHSQITNGNNPHNTTFENIASKPTTLSGYGITDAKIVNNTITLGSNTVTPYSPSNPPPYPVTSVNGHTGAVAIDVPDDLADLNQDSTHRTVTDTEKSTWNAKSDFSGDYNDLSNKPTIPDELADLTDDSTHRLVTDTEKVTWNAKSDFSGSYNDLTDKPTIPDDLADLNDDSTHRLVTDTEKTTWNNKISTETDPTVPSWAKQSSKPTYTASEVGALPDDTVIPPQMLYYGLCTGTATAQTATIEGITEYFDGLTVVLKFNVATQRRATININGIGAVPLRANTDPADTTNTNTTYCPVDTTRMFTYIANDGLFRSCYDYNSDTINKLQETGNIKVSMATYRYKILLQDENGTYAPISTNNKTARGTNNGLATPNTTTKFKIGCPIYYYESTTNLSVNGTSGAVDSSYNASMIYCFTSSTTADQVKIGDTVMTAGNYLPVYLIAKENNDGTFSLDSTLSSTDMAYHITQTLPTTNTGYIYIYLGRLTSAYQLRITVAHPVYKWDGSKYDIYSPVMSVNGMTGNVMLDTYSKTGIVGQSSNTADGYYWYKFADISLAGANKDSTAVFNLWQGYADYSKRYGILMAHVRTNGSGYYSAAELKWVLKTSDLVATDFVLLHNESTSPVVVELWCRCATAWGCFHFGLASEGGRTDYAKGWTLYTNVSAKGEEELPDNLIQVASVINKLDCDITGNATTATSATKDASGNTITTYYQPKLTTQTAYTAKGTSTKVPQITTNSLGQVTSITEVEISGGSSTGFITTFAEDLLLVNGTAASLATGYYYTSSYHIKVNGTTNSAFDDAIIFVNNNYNSQQGYGQIDIWAIKDGNKYYLIQYCDDGEGNYIYQYYANTLLNSGSITTTLPSRDSAIYDQIVPSARLLRTQLLLKEDVSNKVTSLSSSSTDTQYPSAKCVYNQLATKKDVTAGSQDITVLTSDWTSDSTYTGYSYSATKNVTGVTATNDIIVGVSSTATVTQEDEAGECGIRCKGQGSGTITLYCRELPSVDIPITINII